MQNEIFDRISEKLLPTKAAPIASLHLSIIRLWVEVWHRNKAACSKSNPVKNSILNRRPVLEKGVCSGSNRAAQRLQMAARNLKAWKRCPTWFWIDSKQSLQPNRLQMKCDVWKLCSESLLVTSDYCWQDRLQFLNWRFFEQFAFVNNHLLCYWPTIHNSISKICPKFQVLSSHFLEVDELLDEYCAKNLKSEFFSTPIYVECYKIYWSNVCVQEFWYILSALDI